MYALTADPKPAIPFYTIARSDSPERKRVVEQGHKTPMSAQPSIRFVRLETVMALFINELFPGYRVRARGAFQGFAR